MTGGVHNMRYAPPGNWANDNPACLHRTKEMEMPGGSDRHRQRADSPRNRQRIAHAKAICAGCHVLEACRGWALTVPDPAYGMIAAGMTPPERDKAREQAA